MSTNLTRRTVLGLLAARAIIGRVWAVGRLLRLPHQFPSSTRDGRDGRDFRNSVCQRFAGLVPEWTGGFLEFRVDPVLALGPAGLHDV